jgi:hypothetical protein
MHAPSMSLIVPLLGLLWHGWQSTPPALASPSLAFTDSARACDLKDPNNKGLSRKHIIEGTKASLKRLGLEYVDIVFAHRPDPSVPMDEVVRAFNFLIDQGLTYYWSVSHTRSTPWLSYPADPSIQKGHLGVVSRGD